MKASCTSTEQLADICMCRSVLFSILPVTGKTGAPAVSQRYYLTTMLLQLLGQPAVTVDCTALTENKNSCQGVVGTVLLPKRSTQSQTLG